MRIFISSLIYKIQEKTCTKKMCDYAQHHRDFIQLVLIFNRIKISYILIILEMIIAKSNKF